MLDFVAEAVVLVGLLTYARTRGGEPGSADAESKEPEPDSRAQARRPSRGPTASQRPASARPAPAPAQPAEGAPKPTVLDEAADAAQKAWGRLSGWISSAVAKASLEQPGVSQTPKSPSVSEERRPPTPTGRSLWGDSPRYGAGRPASADPSGATPASPSPAREPAAARPVVPANGSQAKPASPVQSAKPAAPVANESAPKEAGPATAPSPEEPAAQTVRAAAGGPPATIRDPVCKLELPWSRAVSLRVGSETLYFCSESCRSVYAKGLEHG
jgi:YHS domain-containing protein